METIWVLKLHPPKVIRITKKNDWLKLNDIRRCRRKFKDTKAKIRVRIPLPPPFKVTRKGDFFIANFFKCRRGLSPSVFPLFIY